MSAMSNAVQVAVISVGIPVLVSGFVGVWLRRLLSPRARHLRLTRRRGVMRERAATPVRTPVQSERIDQRSAVHRW